MPEKPLPHVTIYTDGSCLGNPGPGGWSAVLIHEASRTEKNISGGEADTTNNRMELTAAIKALQALKTSARVDLYSDSAYLINAFNQHWLRGWQNNNWCKSDKSPVLNADLWQELLSCAAKHQVSWKKVQAHVGHVYNERCDSMAKAEAEKLAGSPSASAKK